MSEAIETFNFTLWKTALTALTYRWWTATEVMKSVLPGAEHREPIVCAQATDVIVYLTDEYCKMK